MKSQQSKKFERVCAAIGLMAVVGVASAVWANGDAKICWEAESYQSVQPPLHRVVPGPSKSYSGRGYLEIPWDQNKTKGVGQAYYKVRVRVAGSYYVWARTYWANGCGNSIAVSVNNEEPITLGQDGTYDTWHWVGGEARVALKAGVNTVVLKNRETGVRVDQFFLCQDGDYTPTGIRKDTQ